jgi:hypothetical protein
MTNLKKVGTFVLTDDTLDRHSERILPEGMDLKDFRKNPVMFYNHMRSGRGFFGNEDGPSPIGVWKNIRRANGQIKADAYIHTTDDFAMKIGGKIEDGIIRGASVGVEVLAVSDAPEDKVKGQKGYTITKSSMLEASVVDIPANSKALKIEKTYADKAAGFSDLQEKGQPMFIMKSAFLESNNENINQNMDLKNITDRLVAAVKNAFGVEVKDAEEAVATIETIDLKQLAQEAVQAHLADTGTDEVEALKGQLQTATDKINALEATLSDVTENIKNLTGTVQEKDEEKEDGIAKIQASLKDIASQINTLKGQPSGQTTVKVDGEGVKIEEKSGDQDEKEKAGKVISESIDFVLNGTLTN